MSGRHAPSRLTPDLILQAYQVGYFPMADEATNPETYWVRPEIRGVIPLDGFHLSRSLAKAVRQDRYRVTLDTAFKDVVAGCAAVTSLREETWINADIHDAFCELHELGWAHSVEAWRDDELVGGLYGLRIGGAFFGESMFSTATDASKVCLVHLVARLRAGGFRLLDTQFQNPHLVQFGTIEIDHLAYMERLGPALEVDGDLFALPRQISGSTILQSITQTS